MKDGRAQQPCYANEPASWKRACSTGVLLPAVLSRLPSRTTRSEQDRSWLKMSAQLAAATWSSSSIGCFWTQLRKRLS